MKSNPKPGKHLPFHHPQQEFLRNWIHLQLGHGVFHPRLVCNFDQVWCTLYAPKTTTLQVQDKVAQKSRSMRALRHCLERALQLDHTESFEEPNIGTLKPKIQGGSAASACVDQWRTPRTLTTSAGEMAEWGGDSLLAGRTACQPSNGSKPMRSWVFKFLFPDFFFRGNGISGEWGKKI